VILLISASWVARITGMSYQCLAFCSLNCSRIHWPYHRRVNLVWFVIIANYFADRSWVFVKSCLNLVSVLILLHRG
jgi:hypothetical protein